MLNTNNEPLTHLGDMPIETFLTEYWQKKPLLIRNALSDIPNLEPNEIAGFALEEDIESRILIETPTPNEPLKSQWQLLLGPQHEEAFATLPNTHWTLLVQAVDQLVPEVQQLLHNFRFIPNWRVDDVMVSYATDQGNVGPHFDYYDVFLLQAHGTRLWKLGTKSSSNSQLRQDTDCKILTEFETLQEWKVHPGDLLYIPPQVSHWGIAQGECITYSIGFRAPSHSEILLDYTQESSSISTEDQRYSDESLTVRDNPGLILSEDIEQLKEIILNLASDEKQLTEWFGRYMTQARRDAPTFEPEVENNSPTLAPNCRAAYINSSGTILFINGEQYTCSLTLAKAICAYQAINSQKFCVSDQELITELFNDEILV